MERGGNMLNKVRELLNKKMNEKFESSLQLERYNVIKELLSDDKCFMKISYNDAMNLLSDIGIEDKIVKNVYLRLVEEAIVEDDGDES